jgi:crotonobetainyl-CoA:carnitine CoA-transferase CaiB-like acyl-CoA transferase
MKKQLQKKQTMKTKVMAVVSTALFGTGMYFGNPAWAGQTTRSEVRVYPTSAEGTTYGARYSADKNQTIYCTTYPGADGKTAAFCAAMDKQGTHKYCATNNPQLVTIAQSITDYSFINFLFNSAGTCTYLTVYKGSPYLP